MSNWHHFGRAGFTRIFGDFMKRTAIALLAACSITTTTFVLAGTYVAEVHPVVEANTRSDVNTSVDVKILRFEQLIPGLGSRIASFQGDQSSGKRFGIEEAARFFSPSGQIGVEFDKQLAGAKGYQGTLVNWQSVSVPVTTKSADGRTTVNKSVRVQIGASAFVSASPLGNDHRAEIELRVYHIAPVSKIETSTYSGEANGRLSNGEMLPLFWTNNGVQYAAFLTFQASESRL
ncbi:hypothetical protein [Pseudomonas sp. TSRC2-2]|uniref:hypothetical protein n=1 Tax=unclassified Pseudomonas TaxID=196821 RepID=UPI003CE6A86A